MEITAKMVKELRERTAAGMLDCKKALEETQGNMDEAIDYLRKKGMSKAAKKAGRVASEGLVFAVVAADGKSGAMVEFNSETDFVAKNDEFRAYGEMLVNTILNGNYADIDALKAEVVNGKKIEESLTELIAKIGENMNIRRFEKATAPEGFVASYIHMGGKIGVLLNVKGDSSDESKAVAKDVTMHIAAVAPKFLQKSEVTTDVIDKEKEIAKAQLEAEGKPAAVIEKILEGKMRKYYEENCLIEQKFVKNPDVTISSLIKGKFDIVSFNRYLLGEGIEKDEVDFAEEVRRTVEGK
jgi:elongation factor Ts